jgi:hypothetical protein
MCDSPKLCEKAFNAALKSKVVRSHSAQQLKPKMPLLDEVYKDIPFPTDERECAMFVAGIAECHKYISRHFGH